MKVVVLYPTKKNPRQVLHVETPLGIINITVGLTDNKGRRVVSCEVSPQRYAGELKVRRSGWSNTRLIEAKKARG